MTVKFYCENVDDISIGTKVISHVGNAGSVIEIESDMRDCDGSYGKGFVILWINGKKSFMTKSEIDIWYKHNIEFCY